MAVQGPMLLRGVVAMYGGKESGVDSCGRVVDRAGLARGWTGFKAAGGVRESQAD